MSRFFYGEFFTVNGLPMHVRHIIVYNTNMTDNLLFGLSNNMKKCFNMWLKCRKRGGADLTGGLLIYSYNKQCVFNNYVFY